MQTDSETSGPFHAGERTAQAYAGVRLAGAPIRDFLPEQHRRFFPLLPFLPVALAGGDGWPAATILTGAPGFVSSPDPHRLHVAAHPDAADPAAALLRPGTAIGALGIDLATRRRNRVNGQVASVDPDGFAVAVAQSFGNCPQYIQGRIVADAARQPGALESLGRLDAEAVRQVVAADTFFVASGSGGRGGHADGVDMSHRGGRPGFVRVAGDALVVPDFHGNRYFNTLGNFLLDPRAALLFVDFESGDLLHVAGMVEVDWRPDAAAGFAGAERVWRLHVVRAWRRRGAVPLRWAFRDYAPTTERTGMWADAALEPGTVGDAVAASVAGDAARGA
ncbi:MAG: pyridoxamine 5'-phosphate oxidase family protein [Acetobacteraceae bacterium]|nr:pyridoxamine 5'-phosphate oxidase family protein [Acetobacteraceae bacterium]